MNALQKSDAQTGRGALAGHPVERTLRFLRRAAHRAKDDRGPLRGLNEIRQAVGSEKETVRGYLIKLVARGDVICHEFSSGQCWEARVEKKPVAVEAKDGVFILQRELPGDTRSLWFDAETFTNFERAKRALDHAEAEALHRSQQWGRNDRAQRIRLLSVPA